MARNMRGGSVDFGRANRARDIVPVDHDAAVFEVEAGALGNPRDPGFVGEVHALLERHPCHRAVHGAGIDVAIAQSLRHRPRNCTLAGARRPVDGDDQVPRHIVLPYHRPSAFSLFPFPFSLLPYDGPS
jgi:hypothetical protein